MEELSKVTRLSKINVSCIWVYAQLLLQNTCKQCSKLEAVVMRFFWLQDLCHSVTLVIWWVNSAVIRKMLALFLVSDKTIWYLCRSSLIKITAESVAFTCKRWRRSLAPSSCQECWSQRSKVPVVSHILYATRSHRSETRLCIQSH